MRWRNLNWLWSSYVVTYWVLGLDVIITMNDTEVTVLRGQSCIALSDELTALWQIGKVYVLACVLRIC